MHKIHCQNPSQELNFQGKESNSHPRKVYMHDTIAICFVRSYRALRCSLLWASSPPVLTPVSTAVHSCYCNDARIIPIIAIPHFVVVNSTHEEGSDYELNFVVCQ